MGPVNSVTACRSRALTKPAFHENKTALITAGENPFRLDWFRIVVNFQPVNAVSEMTAYPGISVERAVREITRIPYRVIADLLMSFHQSPVDPTWEWITATHFPVGLLGYRMLPMGYIDSKARHDYHLDLVFKYPG